MDLDAQLARVADTITATRALPALERAAALRSLVDQARVALGAAGDAAIEEAVRAGTSHQEAADRLGVKTTAINSAVTRHRRRAAGRPARTRT